jgi:hypothetical protein
LYPSALDDVLQLGIAKAVGEAVEPLTLASTVFDACVARSVGVISPAAVNVPVIVGLAIVGDVASTGLPEPVTGFANAAETPVPRPDTPVEMGSPVPFVKVTAEGVPRLGVVSVGELESTTEPVPVDVVAPVPPLAAVSGFCSVRLLNVGEGYVWASAAIGTRSAAVRNFFIVIWAIKKAAAATLFYEAREGYEIETTPSSFQTTPADEGFVVGKLAAHAVELLFALM